MSLDIISGGPDSKFIETWAERKARRTAEKAAARKSEASAIEIDLAWIDMNKPGPKPKYSAATRAAVLAAYGVKSATVIGAELGLTKNTVTRMWAEGRRLGLVSAIFRPFEGGRAVTGRLTVRRGPSGHGTIAAEVAHKEVRS